jgi:hypothetical protein
VWDLDGVHLSEYSSVVAQWCSVMSTYLLTHLLTHSIILTHTLVYTLSLTYYLASLRTHSLTHSLTHLGLALLRKLLLLDSRTMKQY